MEVITEPPDQTVLQHEVSHEAWWQYKEDHTNVGVHDRYGSDAEHAQRVVDQWNADHPDHKCRLLHVTVTTTVEVV